MEQTSSKMIELNLEELLQVQQRAGAKELEDGDYGIIVALVGTYAWMVQSLQQKELTIARLQKIIFGPSTEKTDAVVGSTADPQTPETPGSPGEGEGTEPTEGTARENEPSVPRQGHGRNGADAYRGGEKIHVPHESLQAGDPCPECEKGTLYRTGRPGVLLRIVGQAPLQAKVYEFEKLRCNLCGKIFTAAAPENAGSEKYDVTAGSTIALLKYGSGMPFNRLQGLQADFGIPLPASTQWDIVHARAQRIEPAFQELIRQAADGDVVYNDDTTVKILERMGKRAIRARQEALAENEGEDSAESSDKKKEVERRGMFTSGIVSTREGRKIVLFFSGGKHAGENLVDVLAERAAELGPPIQMCDPLSRNMPEELDTIVANCLAHGRRKFADVASHFRDECRHVLEALKVIYRNDATARKENLSPESRLHFHQAESGPIMEDLHCWLTRQIEDRLVEPNSGLGEAISYMLRHWHKLTLFLHQPGAPLDNNICERALKKAILHRKCALFYKTDNGAHVGDVFMSLIYTCELGDANPFDYLNELDRHADELAAAPENWMPWNYRQALDAGIQAAL